MFNSLHYFCAVVESGSFTRAAELCHVSQSAISQQIRSLEEELGITLLKRERRKISLTPAGTFFYQRIETFLKEYEQICEQSRAIADNQDQKLRIGYLQSLDDGKLIHALSEFSKSHPALQIGLMEGSHEDLFQALLDNRVDLVISDQRRAYSPLYVNHLLAEKEMSLELGKEHPLARQPVLTPQILANTPCILISSSGQQQEEEAYYRDIVGLCSPIVFAGSVSQARKMAAAGIGAAIIDCPDTVETALIRIPYQREEEPLIRRYHAFWNRNQSTALQQDFADLLEKSFQHR